MIPMPTDTVTYTTGMMKFVEAQVQFMGLTAP